MEDVATSLSLILRQYSRVRSLRLEVRRDSYDVIAKVAEIDLEAPLLRLLSLQMTDIGPSDGDDVLSLFINSNRVLPAFASLNLGGLKFPWKFEHFPNSLRHLSITHTHYESDYRNMLDTLEGLPLLESLEILHALPRMPEDIVRAPVSLHYLRRLKMACDASGYSQFLAVVRLPRGLELELECDLDDRHTNLPDFAQSVASQLCRETTTPTPLLSVSLRCDELEPWRLLTLRGWRTVQPLSILEDEYTESKADITLKLILSEDLRDREGDAIRCLLPRLPLTKVQAFSIDNVNTRKPEETLVEIFSQMVDLRSLGFSSTPGLAELLRRSGGGQEQEVQDEPRLLPALSSLHLETIRFSLSSKTLAHLQAFLERRKREGTLLEKLILDDCTNLDTESVDVLRSLTGEVEWDEFVSEVDDLSDSHDSEEGSANDENGSEASS